MKSASKIDEKPVFKGDDEIYHADGCDPLVKAALAGNVEFHAWSRGTYPGLRLRKNILPGLRSVGFWNATTPQPWGLPEHRNEGIELTFVENGNVGFRVKGVTYQLNPGTMTITRPWQPHVVGDPTMGANKLHWVIIDVNVRRPHQKWIWPDWLVLTKADLLEMTKLLSQNEHPVLSTNKIIRDTFMEISQILESDTNFEKLSRITVSLNELFLNILDLLRATKVELSAELITINRNLELFLEELDESYAEYWTVRRMAETCHMGVTHFIDLCKLTTNTTPMLYLMHLRVRKAKEAMIEKPQARVTQIAFECGFSTSQYFATCFKEIEGSTPTEFRRSLANPADV